MKPEIKYIEQKSGYSDNGPAWIGLIRFSKTGQTLYFDNKAFRSLKGGGIYANFYDIESGDEYWISGVKKDMTDRHWSGSGMIYVEKRILYNYLNLVEKAELDKFKYKIVEINIGTVSKRVNGLENEPSRSNEFASDLYFKNPVELTVKELEHLIEEYISQEETAKFNKGRRSVKAARIAVENELEKRTYKSEADQY